MAQTLAEKLQHTGPDKTEKVAAVPQNEPVARTPEPPFPNKKEQNNLSRSPDRKEGETQGKRESHLGEREEGQSGSIERND